MNYDTLVEWGARAIIGSLIGGVLSIFIVLVYCSIRFIYWKRVVRSYRGKEDEFVYDRSTKLRAFWADEDEFGLKPAILRLITHKEFHDWKYMGYTGDFDDWLQCSKCGKEAFPSAFAYYPSPMWCEGKKEPDKN